MEVIIILITSYLIGSIPFAYIFTKISGDTPFLIPSENNDSVIVYSFDSTNESLVNSEMYKGNPL